MWITLTIITVVDSRVLTRNYQLRCNQQPSWSSLIGYEKLLFMVITNLMTRIMWCSDKVGTHSQKETKYRLSIA